MALLNVNRNCFEQSNILQSNHITHLIASRIHVNKLTWMENQFQSVDFSPLHLTKDNPPPPTGLILFHDILLRSTYSKKSEDGFGVIITSSLFFQVENLDIIPNLI